MARILVVDDEQGMRELLSILLREQQHEVVTAASVAEAEEWLTDEAPLCSLVISDLRLPDGSGLAVLKRARERDNATQVIMMTAFATAENAVEAMKIGAYDYQTKPFKINEITLVIQKALEKFNLLKENTELKQQLENGHDGRSIIGKSPAIMKTLALIDRVARSKTSVMLLGESGTGKELLARHIHAVSPRASAPFQAVNCGAIPENLIESELFGHSKGAFTGADKERAGLFESANHGTLFLDEVAELPVAMQVKLLRVLQEQTIRRVGESQERAIDVRIIAATNRNISAMVENGEFREDLYYRLNVVTINVPPLRERKDDIPLLARAFVLKYGESLWPEGLVLQNETLDALARYNYPGNVRELENIIERAVALCDGKSIQLRDLPDFMQPGETVANQNVMIKLPPTGINLEKYIDAIEKGFLEEALRQSGGIKTRAAELLGLSFRSMRYRLKKYGFQDEE